MNSVSLVSPQYSTIKISHSGKPCRPLHLPVKGACQDKVVVGADLVKPAFLEVLVVDQTTGLVYHNQRINSPGRG
jgi:hypothetical protein